MISFIYFCWTISQLHSQIDDAVQNCEDLKDSYSSYSWGDDDITSCEDPYKFDIFVMDFFIALIESWFLGVFKEYAKFWWKFDKSRKRFNDEFGSDHVCVSEDDSFWDNKDDANDASVV
ncbi:hypothetical protein TrCOL_g2973 [Triparma columacea]|uniref:Uncharacterized protein n=1 Tax=Triparma columacea TaxID=722753 RepID=A0A9W7G509_9STRA|nr:hypothetical protein TrCOL_g2973 [Triparma columacea]